ncbi:hypothetical protein C8R43DRAFT_698318 [Mycena crocata]|nr:hypothetical protein C8R43DRAFT_698318 [Mycena crocata]
MKLSGPADLDTLRSVCSVFKTILDANPSIWKYARAPLKIPAPPVGRLGNGVSGGALELLQRGDSERNYIMYLFGGGKCTVCGNWTAQLPCSFALGFRCCSKQCRHRVFSLKTQLGLVAIKTGELDRHPGIQWLTPHPAPLGGLYFRADLLAVKQKIQALGRISTTSDEFNFTNATATYWAESRARRLPFWTAGKSNIPSLWQAQGQKTWPFSGGSRARRRLPSKHYWIRQPFTEFSQPSIAM